MNLALVTHGQRALQIVGSKVQLPETSLRSWECLESQDSENSALPDSCSPCLSVEGAHTFSSCSRGPSATAETQTAMPCDGAVTQSVLPVKCRGDLCPLAQRQDGNVKGVLGWLRTQRSHCPGAGQGGAEFVWCAAPAKAPCSRSRQGQAPLPCS